MSPDSGQIIPRSLLWLTLTSLMSCQTCRSFYLLQNTKEDIAGNQTLDPGWTIKV